jgi:hypothetical protein
MEDFEKGAERGDLNALRVGRIDLGTRRVAGCTNSSGGRRFRPYVFTEQKLESESDQGKLTPLLQIKFGQRDSGIRFPRQRLPGSLRSRLRNPEQLVGMGARFGQVSLRWPKFGEARLEQHAAIPVMYHCLIIHFIADHE